MSHGYVPKGFFRRQQTMGSVGPLTTQHRRPCGNSRTWRSTCTAPAILPVLAISSPSHTSTSILRGVPEHVRSDNEPEFVAKSVQAWIMGVGAKTAYIAPGSP